MLYYNRIGVSEGTDIDKATASKECDICHYWYFLNKGFKFQTYVSDRWHNLLMVPKSLNSIAILKIRNADYCCIISGNNEAIKSSAIKSLKNIDSKIHIRSNF